MSDPRGQVIQTYLDAIANPACYCQGEPMHFHGMHSGPIKPGPTCQVRDRCRLFRQPVRDSEGNIGTWIAHGNPAEGCEPFVLWEEDKARQEADAREWRVSMGEHSGIYCGRDPEAAAVNMWMSLRREGIELDKMILFDRLYLVREV